MEQIAVLALLLALVLALLARAPQRLLQGYTASGGTSGSVRRPCSVPGTNLSAGFGQITSTSTEARIIQFALKYKF